MSPTPRPRRNGPYESGKSGLKFVALYIGLVPLADFTVGPMSMEAGFQEGTWAWAVFNIAFTIFMALLFPAIIAPVKGAFELA